MENETEVYQQMLCGYIHHLAYWLRQIPEDKWDWSPTPSAPTPRQIGEHAWEWLVCDRQHVLEPDVTKHPMVPPTPTDLAELAVLLEQEAKWWREFLAAQTAESYLEPRKQFGMFPQNVRGFVFHITQQVVYKVGQLSTLYYALGLDEQEKDKYTAPHPNPIYESVHEQIKIPLFAALLKEDLAGVEAALKEGADPNMVASNGELPILIATLAKNRPLVEVLLAHGADPYQVGSEGYSAEKIARHRKQEDILALFAQYKAR